MSYGAQVKKKAFSAFWLLGAGVIVWFLAPPLAQMAGFDKAPAEQVSYAQPQAPTPQPPPLAPPVQVASYANAPPPEPVGQPMDILAAAGGPGGSFESRERGEGRFLGGERTEERDAYGQPMGRRGPEVVGEGPRPGFPFPHFIGNPFVHFMVVGRGGYAPAGGRVSAAGGGHAGGGHR